ncbi:MAG: hypothetical protein OEV93_05150, partial [Candidatus Moranbacteria bacterium]|nr:hypothetical protein [Candidatus Moranbacteria bacterium]
KAKLSAEEKFAGEKTWMEMVGDMYAQKRKAIIVGASIVAAFVFVAAAIIGAVQFKRTSFNEERVVVDIIGPETVAGAELVTYKIRYNNNNRASLENAEIFLNHSNNFKLENATVNFEKQGDNNTLLKVGEVDSKSEGEVEISGRFYAPKDYVVYLKPTLRFVPSNFSSPFESTNQIGVNVATAPVSMNISASGEALSNGGVEYVIQYKNISNLNFKDVKIEMEYPEGFSFLQSSERPVEGKGVWYIANIAPQEDGEIRISGSLSGSPGDTKVAKVSMGIKSDSGNFVLYNKREDITRIVKSPLVIDLKFNTENNIIANVGDRISGVIRYKNEGDKGLRDVIISMSLDSDMVDITRLRPSEGYYNDSEKRIVWKAADFLKLTNLAPGQSGEINFMIPIKDRLDINSSNDKNYILESVAKIESSDVLYSAVGMTQGFSGKASIKLNSKIELDSRVYFEHPAVKNSGPIPPKVGEKTSYLIIWRMKNWFNDLSGAEVRAHLPTGTIWSGKVGSEKENITFNERTNEVVWNIGDIENGSGVLNSPREAMFQISIIPEQNQVKSIPDLVGEAIFRAKDLFTLQDLSVSISSENTKLEKDDPNSGDYRHGIVNE